jgi:hypothetical protein
MIWKQLLQVIRERYSLAVMGSWLTTFLGPDLDA